MPSCSYVNNVWIPVVLTFLLSFGVAEAFLHVYDLAIATILLCFCEDYKYHNVESAERSEDHDEDSLRCPATAIRAAAALPVAGSSSIPWAGADIRA